MSAFTPEKQIRIGSNVIGRDGSKLGTVAYIVVNPQDLHMTDIVVNTGAFLGREILLPAVYVQTVDEDEVHVSLIEDELEGYPDYVTVEYQAPPPGWTPPTDFLYPTNSVVWPATAVVPEIVVTHTSSPPGTQGISKGMEVETSDGHGVGHVESVDIDPATDTMTGFVVKRGVMVTHKTHISAADVMLLRDNVIVLAFTKERFQELEDMQNA